MNSLIPYAKFDRPITEVKSRLKTYGVDVDAGTWQGYDTKGKPDLLTRELMNCVFSVSCVRPKPFTSASWLDQIALEILPNRAWADEHFAERVGGIAMNPDPSYERWPWWNGQKVALTSGGGREFSHTYSERFWPKQAGAGDVHGDNNLSGIRFAYGDYDDVVKLLVKEPRTRQAYLPIFFPEDTGCIHGGRIPCTLGYQFMLRTDSHGIDRLHCWYHIRSCDYVRHFRDDLYLAVKLMAETIVQCGLQSSDPIWKKVTPGTLHFTCASMHYHYGDAKYV